MGNTGLLRREAEMTLLQPHLGEPDARSSGMRPFGHLHYLNLVRTSFLKKAPQKILRVSNPTRISPFVVPTRKEAPTGNAPMRAISHKAVTNRFPQRKTKIQRLQGSFSTPQ